ncbi:MAG: ATP-binding protein [Clostridia bacterium]|nr:ATP-binding protein [Clostridia bacterium]
MIRKLIRQMLAAQTLSALTVSLCLLIDSILIGRFLGVQAIAAYGLANPILLVIGAIGSMLAAGVQVACSKSLGSGSKEETDKGYSSAIGLTLGISLVFTLLVLIFRSPLATLMGAGSEGELYDHTRDYLAGFIIGAPGCMGALVLVPFLQMAGKSKLLILAVLGMTAADVGFDLLNVLVFDGGMFGMGLASSLSYYVAMAIALGYFLSQKCAFRFSFQSITAKKIRELFVGGIPAVFTMASSVIFVFILNQLLLSVGGSKEGSEAVAAFSVLMTIGNASNCISTGIGGVSLTLSGILYNEEDQTGLRSLLKLLVKYGIMLGASVGVLLAVSAPVLVRVFIPEANMAQRMAIQGVRLFALGLIPCCMVNALKNLYQATERVRLTEIISVMEGVALPALAAFLFSRWMGVSGAWLYFAAGECLSLLCTALYVWKKSGAVSLGAEPFLLLREGFGVKKENLLEMDIHSLQEVEKAAQDAAAFCMRHGQSEKMANHIALCLEEMASNTVIHGFDPQRENHLSVRVQHKGDRWVLRFRDDCRAFDPVSYVPAGEQEGLGIRLVTAMADDIRYTYSLNLNNLTIKLTAK